MGEPLQKGHGPSPNSPNGEDLFSMMLDAMSAAELTGALEDILENMTEEDYDPALIDAYLDALDRKAPIPETQDAKASFAGFRKKMMQLMPESNSRPAAPRRKSRRAWRVGLAAALTVLCMLGGMAVAQAAGVDVFGAIARWTDSVFSFGPIVSEHVEELPNDPALEQSTDTSEVETAYGSFQEALDAYGITEVSAPTWIPEGYVLSQVTVYCFPEWDITRLTAEYSNGTNNLIVKFESHLDEPASQIEKTDAPVETFAVNDMTVYLLENSKNNTAAWVTEHFECLIAGAVEKNELRQMVLSAYANTQ